MIVIDCIFGRLLLGKKAGKRRVLVILGIPKVFQKLYHLPDFFFNVNRMAIGVYS